MSSGIRLAPRGAALAAAILLWLVPLSANGDGQAPPFVAGFTCLLPASDAAPSCEIAVSDDGAAWFVGLSVAGEKPGSLFVAKFLGGRFEPFASLPLSGPGTFRPCRLAMLSGQAWVAGTFSGIVHIAGKTLRSRGDSDIFLCGVSLGSGKCVFLESFGGAGRDVVTGLCASSAGIYFCGSVECGACFRDSYVGNKDVHCYYVARYTPTDGKLTLISGSAKNENSEALALCRDEDGTVWVGGSFFNCTKIGSKQYDAPESGGSPAFVAKLAVDLKPVAVFVSSPEGGSWDRPLCIAPDRKGGCYYAGLFTTSEGYVCNRFRDDVPGMSRMTGFVARIDSECLPVSRTIFPAGEASWVEALLPLEGGRLFIALGAVGTVRMPGLISAPIEGKGEIQTVLAIFGSDLDLSRHTRIAASGCCVPRGAVRTGWGSFLVLCAFRGAIERDGFSAKSQDYCKFASFLSTE